MQVSKKICVDNKHGKNRVILLIYIHTQLVGEFV